MRTGIYLRISQARRDKEADDGTLDEAGINRQREDCLALAEQLGWQVVKIYPDNDASATASKPRPRYREMLVDIRAGHIEAVIAWHTDRLYRQLRDLEELAEICGTHSLAIRTCRSGEIDLSTPTGQLIAEILGSVAKHEVRQKADRWLRSYRQRRQAGRWMGSGPRTFGYTRGGEIVEDEAKIIRNVAAQILGGTNVNVICSQLQKQGVKTTRGNDWQQSSLRALLRSPRIAGLSVLDEEIIGRGQWEPILDRQTWERVCAAISSKKILRPPPRRALLSGLAFCGVEDCGRRLYRTRRDIHLWVCRTETKAFGHVAIAAAPLEEMVEALARARFANDGFRAAVAARLSNAGDAAVELTREIDRLDAEIRELTTAPERSGRSRLAVAAWIDELDAQLATKRAALAELTPVMLHVGDEWPDDIDRRSALIRLVVARVTIFPAKRRGGRFDPDRVRIDPVLLEQPE